MKKIRFILAALFVTLAASQAQNNEPKFPSVSGWKLTVEETVYTPNNLWDIIDGAADLFLEYNFVDLRIARYQTSAEIEIKVELYKHKTSIDAFGMYSQERFPDYHFIKLGTQGYSEKGALNFLSGEYYVKISTVQSAKDAQDAMLTIGTAVEKQLGRERSWPSLLSAFPQKRKQDNTEQYISRNFLGYSFFNGVYTANYDSVGALKAFIMRLGSGDEARRTIDTYLASLPKESITKSAGERFRVRDPHTGVIDFIVGGKTVYGVLGGVDSRTEALLTELGRNLSSAK